MDEFLQGNYFSSNRKISKTYGKHIYKVFLNAKNPLIIDFKGKAFNDYIEKAIDTISQNIKENFRDFYDSIIFKNIIDDAAQNGKGNHNVADTIMAFDSNQIKAVDNRESYIDSSGNITEQRPKNTEFTHKYFNEQSDNIFQSNAHAGSGLIGGFGVGIEQDESGNITFDPAKFALGLLGGTAGSKAVSKGYKNTYKPSAKA